MSLLQGLKSIKFVSNLTSMAKDFEKDELPSFITETSPGKYPSKEDMDHLSYLDKRPSIFEHEEDANLR